MTTFIDINLKDYITSQTRPVRAEVLSVKKPKPVKQSRIRQILQRPKLVSGLTNAR